MMSGAERGPAGMGRGGMMPAPGEEPGTTFAPAAGGPAMAMLKGVAKLDLTSDQRTKLDAIRADLRQRQKMLLARIAAASSKLQRVSREQAMTSRTLSDLKGHLMFANMDAANRAEEMLTDEQHKTLTSWGSHVMTPEQAR
jgi:Spy/CpxP family protein refolding chaperone